MDWKECKYRKFVKEISEDKNLIGSLLYSSKNKVESNKRLGLDETTASAKISLVYDSLRELLEALAVKKRFKIYNHECFSSFLEEICNRSDLSKEFDRFRRIRNQINYYGKRLLVDEAKVLLKEMIALRNKILKDYF